MGSRRPEFFGQAFDGTASHGTVRMALLEDILGFGFHGKTCRRRHLVILPSLDMFGPLERHFDLYHDFYLPRTKGSPRSVEQDSRSEQTGRAKRQDQRGDNQGQRRFRNE
jgi:hypothetical protein